DLILERVRCDRVEVDLDAVALDDDVVGDGLGRLFDLELDLTVALHAADAEWSQLAQGVDRVVTDLEHRASLCVIRILIGEDEPIIRLDLRDLLERSGHEVVAEARDGEEAIVLAREHEPELAVMDVKMPRLDGIEAARQILDERPIPIVMLTAYGQEELVSRAVEAGGFGHPVKPFPESGLLPAVATPPARHQELVAPPAG